MLITLKYYLSVYIIKAAINYNKDFNKNLINRFSSTYNFCQGDINRYLLCS